MQRTLGNRSLFWHGNVCKGYCRRTQTGAGAGLNLFCCKPGTLMEAAPQSESGLLTMRAF